MRWKNMMIWKKQSKIWRLKQFIIDFSLFIKQCHRIVWSVKKNKKKTENKNLKVVTTKMCSVWQYKIKIYQRAES